MNNPVLLVSGTDTGIGKTIFSAALTQALQGSYWKPVQSGLEEETDSETVRRLAPNCPVLSEQWRLQLPASPHLSAQAEGVEIDPAVLNIPHCDQPLVVEGAGGLMVPLTRSRTYLDIFTRWQRPVILCARTQLGTINHSLLSLEALRNRNIPVLGVAFIGHAHEDSEGIICELGNVSRLGRLPVLDDLKPQLLAQAFAENFNLQDFTGAAR
ncbi:dethiobiotin synthase [Pseudochrobactrum sp. sp1633]|uniref:dethiobiotin synthase n=1 Tax=Pseudochrobactrum sp. sp1633 TaxID=3036706 RepID=UPI0025A605DE|nr:dethiobiotin synthase [Pseudochrobactrum sp. sp1633]MDM8344489.1 dethiobiotin synthase [Pseudochrobactrum sp. sp1633]HWD14379.1 dethiobiotin synthase [Pseudochrobactrum sp.]